MPSFDAFRFWAETSGVRLLVIVILAAVLLSIANLGTRRLQRRFGSADNANTAEHAKRIRTLSDLVRNLAFAVIIATAAVMALSEMNVNTTPLLTSAGILGLAVGFGAQTLVKDVISGFFIILEN